MLHIVLFVFFQATIVAFSWFFVFLLHYSLSKYLNNLKPNYLELH